MTDAPTAAETPATESKATDGFLTKEALTSGAHFKREEGELVVPELGGKLLLRGVSFKEQRQIQANLPDTIQGFKITHTAFTLSRYVKRPVLTQEEWKNVLSKDDFPARAMTRINQKIAEIMDISEEEQERVSDEFPATDD
jgi:hypothetical protein